MAAFLSLSVNQVSVQTGSEENLGGACTGNMEDWCTHADNQCNQECVELFIDHEYRATIFPVYYKGALESW